MHLEFVDNAQLVKYHSIVVRSDRMAARLLALGCCSTLGELCFKGSIPGVQLRNSFFLLVLEGQTVDKMDLTVPFRVIFP